VQVYAAAMSVGLLGIGWFMVSPHAAYSVDQANLSTTGEVLVKPAPGLGYKYKWVGDGVPTNDYANLSDYAFVIEPGRTRKVTLAVKNSFGRETQETITVTRPVPKLDANMPFPVNSKPDAPGVIKPETGDAVHGSGS